MEAELLFFSILKNGSNMPDVRYPGPGIHWFQLLQCTSVTELMLVGRGKHSGGFAAMAQSSLTDGTNWQLFIQLDYLLTLSLQTGTAMLSTISVW